MKLRPCRAAAACVNWWPGAAYAPLPFKLTMLASHGGGYGAAWRMPRSPLARGRGAPELPHGAAPQAPPSRPAILRLFDTLPLPLIARLPL